MATKTPTYTVTLELKTTTPPHLLKRKNEWNSTFYDYKTCEEHSVTIKSITVKEVT